MMTEPRGTYRTIVEQADNWTGVGIPWEVLDELGWTEHEQEVEVQLYADRLVIVSALPLAIGDNQAGPQEREP